MSVCVSAWFNLNRPSSGVCGVAMIRDRSVLRQPAREFLVKRFPLTLDRAGSSSASHAFVIEMDFLLFIGSISVGGANCDSRLCKRDFWIC